MPDVIKKGLSVDECVTRLKRYHYTLKRLHEIFVSHITSEPIYELKMTFSLHSHLCAEHVASLRKRVGEMREPPLGLDAVPCAELETFFDEIRNTPQTDERIMGIYAKAIPALIGAMEKHIKDTNPLVDHPSVRVCRFALLELADMAAYGVRAIECLVTPERKAEMKSWLALLDQCLERSGSLDGSAAPSTKPLARIYSDKPYVFNGVPKRDERFIDPFNMGVNAEAFLYDEKFKPEPKVLMMLFKRLREIDVPEMMASILVETKNKPWGYYQDMTRQLWDEARHAMMGEAGFVSLGIDWTRIPINFTWSRGLNTQLSARDRHAVLYFIEQGLMPKTGKRFEWEVGVASKNPLASVIQDYDWADEVLHAQIGRTWYVSEFQDPKQALEYGDRAWSKVLSDWESWRRDGLTEHRNWWPEIYTQACANSGIEPDPEVLAFTSSYNGKRADLREVSA